MDTEYGWQRGVKDLIDGGDILKCGGAKPNILANFSRKLHEIEKLDLGLVSSLVPSQHSPSIRHCSNA